MIGKVYLVGAGPGDPELLTLKAARILGNAEVVLHDSLVSQEILGLASARAEVIHIGKRCGRKLLTQEEINSLLVHYAHARATVVRLKGGDPMLFGHAGEEIDTLRSAGVPFEVVPGVTSGLASAAAAEISLTDRRIASQVLFTTAHREHGNVALDWAGVVGSDTTVVIYMPGRKYAELGASLLEVGLDPRTPCLVASCTSLPTQELKRTTIGNLRDEDGLAAPSLLIVGWVADSAIPAGAHALHNQIANLLAADENAPEGDQR